ncbi:MAG: Asp-tRNA(Asn)/Glu-tRNA(Gln) amidotransferase subunit GatB [Parcubacteria group bacterium]|nr:Asp-tRNA(Asn)/Glu-tRNA(Gln) amidotransferase subunit GatB [Parcubacteria group bacterium]
MKYKPTIGLEIHIELATKSKMFCSCLNNPDETEPNKNICPVCTAQPGVLPVINKEAVKKVIKTALVLNCKIENKSFFERKNYFYPDLPKGYQISQFTAPLSRNGYLELSNKKIRIERIHLEEDTGKLIHPEGADHSLVDLNRAGVPLMELVTEPDINTGVEAREFIKELQTILRYIDASEANMEKGQMRCEVNISIAKQGAKKLGTKVEIKNLNSIKSVEKSIDFEVIRQTKVLDDGGEVIQETRGWHDKKEITFSQREKESSHDYRYFPEPDLPPLDLDDKFLNEIKAEIPELPAQKKQRFRDEYSLPEKEIDLYTSQKDLGEYFEKTASELRRWALDKKPELKGNEKELLKLVKLGSNYIATDLQSLLKGSEFKEEKFKITPENFAEFLAMIYTGEISSKIAKMVLKEMFEKGGDPSQIIADKGLEQITDTGEIEEAVKQVIKDNPKPAEDYKKGKESVLQFLVGQTMAITKGKAKPETVIKLLKKILK